MKKTVSIVLFALSTILPATRASSADDASCYTPPVGDHDCWTHEELAAFVTTSEDRFCSADAGKSAKSIETFVFVLLPFLLGGDVNDDDGAEFRRITADFALCHLSGSQDEQAQCVQQYRGLCQPYCADPANRSKPGCELYP